MIDRKTAKNLANLLGREVVIHDKRDFLVNGGVLSYVPKGSKDSKDKDSGYYVAGSRFTADKVDNVKVIRRGSATEGLVYLSVLIPMEAAA